MIFNAANLALRKRALFILFFVPGAGMATWVTRTPGIRDAVGASISEMGLILFGLSVGSMTGILSAGLAVNRLGTKPVILGGMSLVVASLMTMALGVVLESAPLVTLGLFLFGVGMGFAEIAVNIDGADVEKLIGKPVMHALHGCFSLGTLVGALLGLGMTALAMPIAWHMAIAACLLLALVVVYVRHIPRGTGRTEGVRSQAATPTYRPVWRDPRVAFIGVIVLAMALSEGAANDWLPIIMVDEHGFDPTSGSLIFVAFAAAMTFGRFAGGWFLGRFGRVPVVRASAVLGAVGLGIVIFTNQPIAAGAAVLLWGVGAALGFPLALSAAADGGPGAASRVKAVAIIGYVALLAGPPILGFLGEAHGLRSALLLVLGLVVIAGALGGWVKESASPRQRVRYEQRSEG